MNYLSHYYFDRSTVCPTIVVGTVLPDLLRNADSLVKIRPQQHLDCLLRTASSHDIYTGWNRHLAVDRIFHNSTYFFTHTKALKGLLSAVLTDLPIRPSFFAHIALELLLDYQLITKQEVSIDGFYKQLQAVPETALIDFFACCDYAADRVFIPYYHKFVGWLYIYDYQDLTKIARMLLSICKRLWKFDYTEEKVLAIAALLSQYAQEEMEDYSLIYQEIEAQLV